MKLKVETSVRLTRCKQEDVSYDFACHGFFDEIGWRGRTSINFPFPLLKVRFWFVLQLHVASVRSSCCDDIEMRQNPSCSFVSSRPLVPEASVTFEIRQKLCQFTASIPDVSCFSLFQRKEINKSVKSLHDVVFCSKVEGSNTQSQSVRQNSGNCVGNSGRYHAVITEDVDGLSHKRLVKRLDQTSYAQVSSDSLNTDSTIRDDFILLDVLTARIRPS